MYKKLEYGFASPQHDTVLEVFSYFVLLINNSFSKNRYNYIEPSFVNPNITITTEEGVSSITSEKLIKFSIFTDCKELVDDFYEKPDR
jgi:hypothetical protein